MKKEPCKDCEKRPTGENRTKSCHDSCPEYLATKRPPKEIDQAGAYLRDKSLMLKAKFGPRRY